MSEAAELHDALSVLATFGEVCTFTPVNGSARTITAVVDETRDFTEGGRRLTSQERVSLYALKDVEHATYGGIDEPQMGDAIETSRYPGKRYSWSGDVEHSDRVSWKLKFNRELPFEIGGNRR